MEFPPMSSSSPYQAVQKLCRSALCLLALVAIADPAAADGPADNHPDTVRRIPKLGVELPAEKKAELEASLQELDDAVAPLSKSKDARVQELLPDIRIYSEAVRTALAYQEFFDVKETGAALELLAEGKQRAKELAAGRAPGPRKPASSCGATFPKSTAPCSRTAS